MVKFHSVARGLELKLSCLEDLQKKGLKCISERGLAKPESIPEQSRQGVPVPCLSPCFWLLSLAPFDVPGLLFWPCLGCDALSGI